MSNLGPIPAGAYGSRSSNVIEPADLSSVLQQLLPYDIFEYKEKK